MLVTETLLGFIPATTTHDRLVCLIQERSQIVPHSYMQRELVRCMRAAHTQCSGEMSKEYGCTYSSLESFSAFNFSAFGSALLMQEV